MRDAFYNNALSKANLRKAVTSRMPKVREAKLRAKMSSRVLLNFRHLSSAKTFPSRPVRQCGRKFPRKLLLSVPVTDDSAETCVFQKLIFHPLLLRVCRFIRELVKKIVIYLSHDVEAFCCQKLVYIFF